MSNLKVRVKRAETATEPAPAEEFVEPETRDPLSILDAFLRESVGIDASNIDGEFRRIPGDLAYWNTLYAHALRDMLKGKMHLDVTRARLDSEMRIRLLNEGAKVTESNVAAMVEQDQEFMEVRLAYIDAEVRKNEMFGAVDAVRAKKDMLISLGAQLRAEMGNDPSIREQARSRRVHEENVDG